MNKWEGWPSGSDRCSSGPGASGSSAVVHRVVAASASQRCAIEGGTMPWLCAAATEPGGCTAAVLRVKTVKDLGSTATGRAAWQHGAGEGGARARGSLSLFMLLSLTQTRHRASPHLTYSCSQLALCLCLFFWASTGCQSVRHSAYCGTTICSIQLKPHFFQTPYYSSTVRFIHPR